MGQGKVCPMLMHRFASSRFCSHAHVGLHVQVRVLRATDVPKMDLIGHSGVCRLCEGMKHGGLLQT